MSQHPRRHHFLPEFFTRRWCVGEKLTRYVRTPSGIHCKEFAPKAVAFRTDLYKLEGVGVRHPYSIETHTYQQLDSESALVLRKLLSSPRAEPCDDEMVTLALFLLALPARNPWSLVHGEKIAREAHKAELNADPELAAALKTPQGQSLFEAIENALPHLMANQTRQIMVKVWADPSKVRRLLNMHWLIPDLSASQSDLILSDRALIRHGDLLKGNCALILPVSPKRILCVTDMPDFVERLARRSDEDIVHMTNRDSAYQAKEHIFATGRQHVSLADELLGKSSAILV